MVNYSLVIGIALWVVIFAILIFAVWYLIRRLKRRKQNKLQKIAQENPNVIPQEVIDDFTEAEKRIKEGKGDVTAQQILWDLSKKHIKEVNNGIAYNNKEAAAGEGSGSSYSTATTIQPGSRTSGAAYDSEPANEDIRRDRELEQGGSIQIQSDNELAKGKRKSKRNWAKFE